MARRHSASLLLRLAPASTGMLRFLLEAEENLGLCTTLDRREALLRLSFSPDDAPRVRRWLARAAQSLELEILPWPKGFKEAHFSARHSWAASQKPEGASAMASLKYRRALLKLSGESLAGSHKTGIDPGAVAEICEEIGQVLEMGVEMALVIGGGNIFRGLSASARGMERSSADYMGMLATVLNALAVQDMLEKLGHPTRVLSAINMREVCEPFVRRRALRHLEKHRVVICAGGTGNPYFTTDTTAALRGMELKCDVIIKATRVDGIYDRDPEKDPCAVKYASLTYEEALGRHLGIMDATAFALLRENNVPIIVCRMFGGDIRRALLGEDVGTLVSGQPAHP